MNQKLNNLRSLFSDNDNIVYRALMEKKDWINKSFYLMMSLDDNVDVEDIIEGRLRFKKRYLDQTLFSNEEEFKIAQEKFLSYRVLYLLNDEPKLFVDNEFAIKINFQLLNDREYKYLFANFYPSLERKDILQKEDDETLNLLKKAMDDLLGDNVIIMHEADLVDNCFYSRVVDEIILPSSLNDEFVKILKLLAYKLNIETKEAIL